jgi:competence protein ComEA
MRQALYVLIGVLAGFILAGTLVFVSRAPSGEPIVLEPAPTKAPIAVHVIGAVPRPGLYEFPEDARVQDAIDAAGGMLAEADENAMNLAALLVDGEQLDVPYKSGSQPDGSSATSNDLPTSNSGSEDDDTANSDLININTATLEELDSLPGIGPTTAQKILDYRDANGPFSVIEDIMNVSGIGPATFGDIKDLITT